MVILANRRLLIADISPLHAPPWYIHPTTATVSFPHESFSCFPTSRQQAIYHPTNLYLIHLDRKSGDDARRELEAFIAGWPNVRWKFISFACGLSDHYIYSSRPRGREGENIL